MARLSIIAATGDLPIDHFGANLFFELIRCRPERGPKILTSNQGLGAWGDTFGDRVIAPAILDRLRHHAMALHNRGNSHRLEDKLAGGSLRDPKNRAKA